jgi:hypothetical protein
MKIFLDDFIVFNDLSNHLEKLRKCLWNIILSLYYGFYHVIIFGGTYITSERKMQNAYLDVKLCL